MIIKYYRGYVSKEYLTELTKTNKCGTTAFHIIEAAKKIGFESKGIKLELNDLKKYVLPCIAHVTINKSFNHYIVIYEINYEKEYLIIGDPAKKLEKISFSTFAKIWNNIIITFIPVKTIPVLQKEAKATNIIKLIYKNICMYLKTVYVSAVIFILLSLVCSFSFKIMLDETMDLEPKKMFIFTSLTFICLEMFKNIFGAIRNKFLIMASHKIDWNLTKDIFEKIISLPYRYYRNHTTGDIVSRIHNLDKIKEISTQIIIIVLIDLPLMILSGIALFFINRNLFTISVLILISLIIINSIFNPIYKKYINTLQEKSAYVNNNMIEKISGFETIKGLGIEDEAINNFENNYFDFHSNWIYMDKLYNIHSTFKTLLSDLGSLILFSIGCLLVFDNKMTFGNLLAFNSLFIYFIGPVKSITDLSTNLKEAINSLERVQDLVIKDEDSGIICRDMIGDIEYKNLNFSYDDMNKNLDNINLKIKAKDKVLILGDSGAGKSTMLKILMKYYKVNRNQLFIDNVDINDYSMNAIKQNICYISQNEILFNDSLINNLKAYRNINNEEIEEMLDFCYIREIFKNSNLGFQTQIEENGFNLSGGERQRIILGRSLLKKFNILIIDEGLNQVDISLERKILKNVLKKYKDKTIIVISHRLENMDLFNHVIKFKKNRISEDLVKNA